jgi:hypothetical protein
MKALDYFDESIEVVEPTRSFDHRLSKRNGAKKAQLSASSIFSLVRWIALNH